MGTAIIAALVLHGADGAEARRLEDIHLRDPFILPVKEEGRYYLFGTIAHLPPRRGFDVWWSTDLVEWRGPTKAFRPPEGFWGSRDFWAPEVHKYKGKYYMFATFKAPETHRGTQILVSEKPQGPYRVHSEKAVTPAEWESLDGTLYVEEDGTPWMVFCHEWVQVGNGEMCAMPLTPELDAPAGEPRLLFKAGDAPWQTNTHGHPTLGPNASRVTDGPWLHRLQDGALIMLWSSFTKEKGYAVGVARSSSSKLTGPWTHDAETLFSDDGGHPMMFRTFDGALMLVFHAPNQGGKERPRLHVVTEKDGTLSLKAAE